MDMKTSYMKTETKKLFGGTLKTNLKKDKDLLNYESLKKTLGGLFVETSLTCNRA